MVGPVQPIKMNIRGSNNANENPPAVTPSAALRGDHPGLSPQSWTIA